MNSIRSHLNEFIPEIDPDQVVTKQYGANGLKTIPQAKASDITCYSCGSPHGYFNVPWDAWCCRNEKCWGHLPDEPKSRSDNSIFNSYNNLTLRDLGCPEKYQNCNLQDCYQTHHKIEHFRSWAKDPKGFLIFAGGAGSGKTFAAYAILAEFLKSGGKNARFFNVADLYFEYRNEVSEKSSAINLIGRYSDCRVLLMDDLGQRTPTDAYLEFLYVLINKRYEKNLSTIVTTNLNGEGLEKKLGEAIASRALSGQNHFFDGKDRRLEINRRSKIESIK